MPCYRGLSEFGTARPAVQVHVRLAPLAWVAVAWAIVTALTYWVALRSTIVQRIEKLDGEFAALLQTSRNFIPSSDVCINKPPGTKGEAAPPEQTIACQQFYAIRDQQTLACRDLTAIFQEHSGWHPIGWVVDGFAPNKGRLLVPGGQLRPASGQQQPTSNPAQSAAG